VAIALAIGSFRQSDTVILTKGGSKLITEYPRELESLILYLDLYLT